MLLLFTLLSCGNKDRDSATSDAIDTGVETLDTNVEPQTANEVFRVPNRPWDLALSTEGLIYCSAQGGNTIYIWDPVTAIRTEFPRAISDVQNILFDDDVLFFTRTDNGVTGDFSMWQVINQLCSHTQADDGTLLRWPMDFVKGPNDEWVIADYKQGLFVIDRNGSVKTAPAGASQTSRTVIRWGYAFCGW